jgi:FtsH-binding integral membrane protein
MEVNELERMIREKEGSLSMAFPALMRKVYVWMTLALLITGVTAYGVAASPSLVSTIYSSKAVVIGLFVAEIALVMWITARLDKLSLQTATLLFILYSVLNGVVLSSVFLVFQLGTIAKVFFITAGTFAATAAYGYFTHRDLTRLGSLLMMLLIGVIIATVVNVFLIKSTMFDLVISYIGVAVFVGLTAWDTQSIKRMLAMQTDMGEGAQKIALFGALNLYLDFINLFLYILRIFARSDS